MLVGIHITDLWLNEAVTVLRFEVGKVPFLYLGLSIGGDLRRLLFCVPILNRIKNRLYSWNEACIALGLYFASLF